MIKWQELPYEHNLYGTEEYCYVITPRHQVLLPASYKEIENYQECTVYGTNTAGLNWQKLEVTEAGEKWIRVHDEDVLAYLENLDAAFHRMQNALVLDVNVDMLLKWKNC